MWYNLSHLEKAYMQHEGHTVSQNNFIDTLENKTNEEEFFGDIKDLLRPEIGHENERKYDFVKTKILLKI